MRLQQFLNELAMKKGEVKYGIISPDEFYATIITDTESMDYSFSFHAKRQSFPVVFKILLKNEFGYKENHDGMIMDLSKKIGGIWEIDFEDEEGMYSIAPKERGVSLQLFAGLEEILRRFEKKYKPNVFYFGAYEEPSRIKLYKFIAAKIKKAGFITYEFHFAGVVYFFFLSKEAKEVMGNWVSEIQK